MAQKILKGWQQSKLSRNTTFKNIVEGLASEDEEGELQKVLEKIQFDSYYFNDDFVNDREVDISMIEDVIENLKSLAAKASEYAEKLTKSIDELGE